MKEENASYLWFACFFFFIVLLVLIGSFLLYRNHRSSFTRNSDDNQNQVISDKMKREKDKEFVYFEMEEKISVFSNFSSKKAKINLFGDDAEDVNQELSEIYDQALNSVIKSNDSNHICSNENDLYFANLLDYAVYSNQQYVTLTVMENAYSCSDAIHKPLKVHAYTFDVLTGKLVSYDDLLKKFHFTYTELLEKVKNQLQTSQTMIDNTPNIKIEETLNEFKKNETYVIYLSEMKKLVVKYIVKTNSVDYNDIIEIN